MFPPSPHLKSVRCVCIWSLGVIKWVCYCNPYIPTQNTVEDLSGQLQSPGWQLTLCVAWWQFTRNEQYGPNSNSYCASFQQWCLWLFAGERTHTVQAISSGVCGCLQGRNSYCASFQQWCLWLFAGEGTLSTVILRPNVMYGEQDQTNVPNALKAAQKRKGVLPVLGRLAFYFILLKHWNTKPLRYHISLSIYVEHT